MHDGFLNSRPRLVGGGLEALQRFFEALPIDSGLAFVVIAHLDPTQKAISATCSVTRPVSPW